MAPLFPPQLSPFFPPPPDDDTAALLAELDRIKKERAEESARKDQQRAQAEQLEKQQQAARGNPLLELDPLGRPIDPTDFNSARGGFSLPQQSPCQQLQMRRW